jgi:hypothetical protein
MQRCFVLDLILFFPVQNLVCMAVIVFDLLKSFSILNLFCILTYSIVQSPS